MQNKSPHTKTPNIIPQAVDDVLGHYPRQFRTYLESREYSPQTLRDYVRSINALGTLMQRHEITLADLDEAEAVKLFSEAEWPASSRQSGNYMVRSFVRFLIERGVE